MLRKYVSVLAASVLAALSCTPSTAWAQATGAAQNFAIVGGQAVSANGAGSLINGDVGVAPGTAISGFPASANTVPPYTTHSNDAAAIAAQAATQALYNSLAAAGPAPLIDAQLSGQILGPGIYSIGAADLASSGVLRLRGAGPYIFKVASSLTANVLSTVVVENGANPCDVYWQVTSAATLNGVNFVGTVVAQAAVTLGVGDILVGRALTTSLGSVTLSGTNTVGGCSVAAPAPAPPPGPTPPPTPGPEAPTPDLYLVKAHVGNFVVGTNATYSIALFNIGSASTSGTYTVTDTLPAGLTFVSATGVGWSCSASGQIVTCTSSTVVSGGPGPNNINLTVSPGASGIPAVTNRAVVSGGGDTALANNTTIDVTIVAPAAIPPIAPVPTLPEWAMIALMVLLAVAGFIALRRRAAGQA